MRLIAVWYKITIPPENVLSCNAVYIVILNLKFEIELKKYLNLFLNVSASIKSIHNYSAIFYSIQIRVFKTFAL